MRVLSILLFVLSSSSQALEVRVWPEKLWVKPGEAVVLRVTSEPGAVIDCRVVHQVDTVAASFEGMTDGEGQASFSFTPPADWGYEAVVTAVLGEARATASEVFSCAASPFMVAVDYSVPEVYGHDVLPDGSPAPEGEVQNPQLAARIDQQVARFRHQYLTVGELMGPAFCSFSSIVPPVPNYYKAAHYNYSVNAIRQLIRELHDNGIATLIYVNACASGIAGTEFARQHPEYLAYSADGTPFVGGLSLAPVEIHQWYIENYPDSMKQVQGWYKENPRPEAVTNYKPKSLHGGYPGFINAWLDFRDPKLSEIGAEKIIEGQEYYGYMGVRYDGEYRVPSIGDPLAPSRDFRDYRGVKQPVGHEAEEMTARNLNLAFGKMREHDPDFLIGLNYADFRNDGRGAGSVKAPVTGSVSPGVWILDEVAKGALNPSHPDHHWEDFIRNMSEQNDRTRQVGNYLFAGWGGGPGQKVVDTRQVKAVSWACGLRWICGGYSKAQWFADVKHEYNRFALRYSQYLFDNRLRRLSPEEAAAVITVESGSPLLWEHFVQRLGDEYMVVHLINAPLEKGLTADAQPPLPAEGVRITLTGGMGGSSVKLVSPELPVQALEIAEGAVSVPRIENWGMLIVTP